MSLKEKLMLDQWITLAIIAVAIILLVFTRLRPDLIALMVLATLGLSQVVGESKVFSGFSSSAVMTILGISMISIALQQTGVANALGRLIYQLGKHSELLLVLLVSLVSALLSLFMNNIAAVGILLPAIMSLSRRSQTTPNRLLIPLAFGTILGGMTTLLTTSNIIVSGALKDAGFKGFGLLDFLPIGGPVVVVGILYLITLGRQLMPVSSESDKNQLTKSLGERLNARYFPTQNLTQLRVNPESPLIGKKVSSCDPIRNNSLHILSILHDKRRSLIPISNSIIHGGDILVIQGNCPPEVAQELKLQLISSPDSKIEIGNPELPLAEFVLSPHASLIGKTLCEIDFRVNTNLHVLGIWRGEVPLFDNLSKEKLRSGDTLLVQGSAESIHQLLGNRDLLLLEEDPDTVFRPQKFWLALAITLITLGLAALDIFPIALVVLAGAAILILTGCLTLNDAYQRIEWRAIFLIAGLWPLSIAISQTGLAANLINALLKSINPASPLLIAAIFLIISMLFTQFMSGPVTPIIITPLALAAAKNFGIDPHPLAMMVALGCSLAFMSPIAHPVNIMVMNPGGYSFKDYFKVGLPLTLLSILTILTGLHLIWGL
jgi:di/tricarboxylate transporter